MRKLEGYAAIFDKLSLPIGGSFREIIRKGAFAESLRTVDVRFLWNHDSTHPLGRTSAGNLRLSQDAKGLKFELDLPDTATARDLLELVTKRIVSQMSFGFVVPANGDSWERAGADGLPTRVLHRIDLMEISGTTFPAYPQTELHARAAVAVARIIPTDVAVTIPRSDFALRRKRIRLLELCA